LFGGKMKILDMFIDLFKSRQNIKEKKVYVPEEKRNVNAFDGTFPMLPSYKINILNKIKQAIEDSKYILSFEKDWDYEGSEPYNKEVWDRATLFVLCNVEWLLSKNLPVYIPRILPGPNGSIDVYWKTKRFDGLLNFPDDNSGLAHYYIGKYEKEGKKGNIKYSNYCANLFKFTGGNK